MSLISPLISKNRKLTDENKKKLKEVTKKIEDGMNETGGEMDGMDDELNKL
jgi:hypothetical protein